MLVVKDLADCNNISITAKNRTKLAAGNVSKRIIRKLCQYFSIVEKSENISEKKLKKPDWLKPDKSILNDGTSPTKDPTSVIEKIMTFLKTKRRSSLRMRFNIFPSNPFGGSTLKVSVIMLCIK